AEGGDLGGAHEGEVLRPEEDHAPLARVVVARDGGEVVIRLLCVHLGEVAADQGGEAVGRELVTDGEKSHEDNSFVVVVRRGCTPRTVPACGCAGRGRGAEPGRPRCRMCTGNGPDGCSAPSFAHNYARENRKGKASRLM